MKSLDKLIEKYRSQYNFITPKIHEMRKANTLNTTYFESVAKQVTLLSVISDLEELRGCEHKNISSAMHEIDYCNDCSQYVPSV